MNMMTTPPRENGAAAIVDLTPSFFTRIRQGVTWITTGKIPDWFGPRAPLPPVAPPDVGGRQFDYMVGTNINVTPKAQEGIGYATLRELADAWPILRLIIETQKDRLTQLDWNIVQRQNKMGNARCQEIEKWFRMPDKEHTWEEWSRMLLEDLLVIDAPCLFPRPAKDGTLYGLEPVDGATIKRIITDYGRTPDGEFTAYQQILHGMPAANFLRDELIFRPRNVRSNRIYGYSQVEQMVTIISLALQRLTSQIEYYKSGSTPDLILSVPEGWTPEQIAKFKIWWDSVLKGNIGARRGTMFVFKGQDVVNTKDQLFVDKVDEWLARVACFCFGVSPQPFIQQNNRAAAVAAATQAKEEGLAPIMAWFSNMMNFILAKYFNAPELMFMFEKTLETDPLSRAQICNLKTRAGAMTIDQWRAVDGDEPLPNGQGSVPMIYVGTGCIPVDIARKGGALPSAGADTGQTAPKEGGTKPSITNNQNRQKQTNSMVRVPNRQTPNRNVNMGAGRMGKAKGELRPVTKDEVELAAKLAEVLRGMEQTFLVGISNQGLVKNRDPDAVLASVATNASGMAHPMIVALTKQVEEGYASATQALTKAAGAPLATGDATAYAAARAAALISQIDDTTRMLIRETVVKAIEEEWSVEELAKALAAEYAFSPARAATIASTEMNDALTHAQLQAWESTGMVKGIEWVTSLAEGVCAVCAENEDAGMVELGKSFPSGDDGPPAHPNCRCGLQPVTDEDYP